MATKQAKEGQTSFNTITIDDDQVEKEIAEQCKIIDDNRIAHSAFDKATRRRKELLLVESLEEPSEVIVKGGDNFGNWIIKLKPGETQGYTVQSGRSVGITATQQ